MTKAELIEAVAEEGRRRRQTPSALSVRSSTSSSSRAKTGDKVAWPGFGSFSTSQSQRPHRPQPADRCAGEDAASTAMKFTASSTLKAELNK